MIQTLLAVLLLGLGAVLQHPALILRSSWITRLSEREGIHWTGLRISERTPHWFRPRITLSWDRARVRTPTLDSDVRAGEISVSLNFLHLPPQVSVIGPVRIPADDVIVHPAKTPAPSKPGSGSNLLKWLRPAKIGEVLVSADRWVVPGDSGRIRIAHQNNSSRWQISGTESHHHIDFQLVARHQGLRKRGQWLAILSGNAKEISTQIRRVQFRKCRLNLSLGSPAGDSLVVGCPMRAFLHLPHIPRMRNSRIKEEANLVLSSRLSSADLLDTRRRVEGKATLKMLPLDPFSHPAHILRAWAELHASGSGIPEKPARSWKMSSHLDLQLDISRFQKLVRILDPTKFAVPAPLHALRGRMRLSAGGNIDFQRAEVPIHLTTHLHSQDQDFDVALNGKFLVRQFSPVIRSELNGTLVLTKVRIPLPHIDYKALPRIVPDPRIRKGPPTFLAAKSSNKMAAGRAPAFQYHLKVNTAKNPILIESNLTHAPVPVQVALALNSATPVLGEIHVESFPLNLFRRNAKVDHIDLELTAKEKRISGLLQVNYTDYVIYAHILGTVDEPAIKFTSNPPLSDQDVISVLLFGRTTQDLDSGQTQSVGNVRSAVATRGLDLASLYLLASTPVESVGYDPESRTFTAKFRIAAGTSLNVAESQSQLESVAVRHRIGGHWTIITQYGNPADPTDHSISTLFEWSHRY